MVEAVNNKTSVVKGTVSSGAVGAAIVGTAEYFTQKSLLKNPAKIDEWVKNLAELKNTEATSKIGKTINNLFIKNLEKGINNAKKLIESGKVDWKGIGKMGAIGLAVFAGTYLAYRGIKALFTKNN